MGGELKISIVVVAETSRGPTADESPVDVLFGGACKNCCPLACSGSYTMRVLKRLRACVKEGISIQSRGEAPVKRGQCIIVSH